MAVERAILETELWRRVQRVEPTKAQTAGASRSHNALRDVLSDGRFGNRLLGDFLTGSYARDTAIAPLDDVDLVFLIDPQAYPTFLGPPDVEKVLQSFAGAIRYRYPNSSVRVQNRSVGLQMLHLDIDVVPAIAHKSDGYIYVPDRAENSWIVSGPLVHTNVGRAINKKRNGLFKPLVKLLKAWNAGSPTTANVRSFLVETLAMRIFDTTNFGDLLAGSYLFFDFLAGFAGGSQQQWPSRFGVSFGFFGDEVPDVAVKENNVASRISGDRRDRFLARARLSRDRIGDAVNARSAESALQHLRSALQY